MNVELAVACDHALIDQAGKLSVIGIFERIWVERFPAVHPRLHLVLRLKGRRTEIGQHDFVMNDGDFFKGGFGGQGLYVSPSRDLVIAFFCTFDENGKGHEMTRVARQLAKSGLFDG